MQKSIYLYKYMPARFAISSIEHCDIKVSTFDTLNDPFELEPHFIFTAGDRRADEELFARTWKKVFFRQYGMISMSAVLRDPVLWAHYADAHEGIALEFNHRITDDLVQVEYSNDRPTVEINKWGPTNHDLLMKTVLSRKWKSWQYELEYRSYIELEKCTPRDMKYFQRIPSNFLTRVILGVRCAVKPEYVKRALNMNGFNETQVVEAKMSDHSYEIEA